MWVVIATLFGAAATAFVADWPKLAPDEDLIIEREGVPNLAARHDELYAFPERELSAVERGQVEAHFAAAFALP